MGECQVHSGMQFYTYVHKTDDGRVFYIGKGHAGRAWDAVRNRNPKWHRVSREQGCNVTIVFKTTIEKRALEVEATLIAIFDTYRDPGLPSSHDDTDIMCNFTRGGDGRVAGWTHTEEWKANHSAIMTGRTLSQAHCDAMSASRKGVPFSAEHCANISAATKGRTPWMKGKTHTPESIAKMAASQKAAAVRRRAEKERQENNQL